MSIFAEGSRKHTRRGTKANHAGEKLVNVTNDIEVKRVRRSVAAQLVATGEYRYCPKKFRVEVKQ